MPFTLPPPPSQEPSKDTYVWVNWFQSLYQYLTLVGRLAWSVIDFTGSSITDIASREHKDLQSLQGGTTNEYYHLTASHWTGLTDGDDTQLHNHQSDFTQTFLMMGA